MTKLKPCQFCGSERIEVSQAYGHFSKMMVWCKNCNAASGAYGEIPESYIQLEGDTYRRIPNVSAEEVAIAAWNRRVKDG